MEINGIYTALITPFDSADQLDEACLHNLIQRQIDAGIHGIVIAGSTGEGLCLRDEEWLRAIKLAATYRKQIRVWASCGSSSTWQSKEKFEKIHALGLDGALISSPPYNKPTQDGLVAHYREIAQVASQLPIMVYNIPGRTAVTIQASTMTEIWKIPNVLALKESSGSWQTFLDMSQHLPAKKTLLCGDDASALAFYLHGAKGLVSVLSNLCPKACIEIWDLSQKNLWTEAKNLFDRYKRLLDLLFIESNPIPIKYAVAHSIGRELLPRLPLLGLSERFRTELEREMKALQKEGHLK